MVQFWIIFSMLLVIIAGIGYIIFLSYVNNTEKHIKKNEPGVRLMDSRHEQAIEMDNDE